MTQLRDLNYRIVLAEYPSYGTNQAVDTTISQSLMLRVSEQLMLREAERACGPVVLMGYSMGSAVATFLSAKHPNIVDRLILIASFPSMAVILKHITKMFPWRLIVRSKFKAFQWAERVRAPVTMLHGANDSLIPIAVGRKHSRNFAQAASLRFVELEGVGHTNLWDKRKTWDTIRFSLQ